MFVRTKLMKDTNTELSGVGETREIAKLKLKEEVSKYRFGIMGGSPDCLKPTGEMVRSPRFVYYRDNDTGKHIAVYDNKAESPVFARPDLADYIQKERRVNGQK